MTYSLEWAPDEPALRFQWKVEGTGGSGGKAPPEHLATPTFGAPTTGTLTVTIHSASDLTGVDRAWGGGWTSDPYVELTMQGWEAEVDDAEGGVGSHGAAAEEETTSWITRSTKVRPKTLSPQWEQAFAFHGPASRLAACTLELVVFDYDLFSRPRILVYLRS